MSGEKLLIAQTQAVQIFYDVGARVPETIPERPFVTQHDVELQFTATTLGMDLESDAPDVRITGNTVPRLCEAATGCSATVCGLGELLISDEARRERNCAATNTVSSFMDTPGFVLSPTNPDGNFNNDAIFLSDPGSSEPVTVLNEAGEPTVLFNKIKPGATFIISEHDLETLGVEKVAVELNGADSSWAALTLKVQHSRNLRGTRYAVVMFSSQSNLGSRSEKFQIARKSINSILDREGVVDDERDEVIPSLTPQIDVGYSASLENFAHLVTVPAVGSKMAKAVLEFHGITGEAADTTESTPTQVMNFRYPKALEKGEIYGQFEGENNLEDSPRGPGGCPGHRQLCHIHYPKITRRTLVDQLEAMGIPREQITYNNDQAVDPANRGNGLASNRLFQLAGVAANKTPRTANTAIISFPEQKELANA